MKKIFTLLTSAIVALGAWAAAPVLYFGDVPVVAGKTYRTGYTLQSTPMGEKTLNVYTQDADIFLYGLLGEDVTVEVNATPVAVSVCSLDGLCIDGESVVKKGSLGTYGLVRDDDDYGLVNLDIHKITTDLTGASAEVLLQEVTVNVKAYYDANPSEYAETTVVLTKQPASEVGGVNDIKAESNAAVTAGPSNVLNYNVAAPTKFELYNVNGALVMSRTINSIGSISLDSLHPGVYIYAAGTAKGKVLVHK